MKIDYFKLLREAAKFSWKYKVLWIFGFILALFSGSVNLNMSSNGSDSGTSRTTAYDESLEKIGKAIIDFYESPCFWPAIICGAVFILLYIAVSWYLTRVSKVALIKAVEYDKEGKGKEIRFGNLWKETHTFLPWFLVFDLIWFGITWLIIIVFIVPLVLVYILGSGSAVSMLFCCLIIPITAVAVVFMIVSGVLKETAIRLMVLERLNALESLKKSYDLVKRKSIFWKYVLAWLVALLPGCLFFLVILGLVLVTIFPLLIVVMALFVNVDTMWLGLGIGAGGFCLIFLGATLLQAPYKVFTETYWTKFMMLLFKEEEKKISVEEAEVVERKDSKG